MSCNSRSIKSPSMRRREIFISANRRRGLAFRHDHDARAVDGAISYALECPPYGGDRLFANQYRADEALSDGTRSDCRPFSGAMSCFNGRGASHRQARRRPHDRNAHRRGLAKTVSAHPGHASSAKDDPRTSPNDPRQAIAIRGKTRPDTTRLPTAHDRLQSKVQSTRRFCLAVSRGTVAEYDKPSHAPANFWISRTRMDAAHGLRTRARVEDAAGEVPDVGTRLRTACYRA